MLTRIEVLVGRRVDARPISVTRVLLGLALILVTVETYVAVAAMSRGALRYPAAEWLPDPTPAAASGILVVGWVAGVCLVIGLLPEVMAATGAALGFGALLWDQQLYSSHLTLLSVLLVFLAFAQSDRRRGITRSRYQHSGGAPFWPQLLMMTQVTALYLFAGLSKAQPVFLSGRPLEEWMWLDLPTAAYPLLAWSTVLTEVCLAVALWFRRVRRYAVVVGVILHLSIVFLLVGENAWLAAFALTTLSTYPLFLTRPDIGVTPDAEAWP